MCDIIQTVSHTGDCWNWEMKSGPGEWAGPILPWRRTLILNWTKSHLFRAGKVMQSQFSTPGCETWPQLVPPHGNTPSANNQELYSLGALGCKVQWDVKYCERCCINTIWIIKIKKLSILKYWKVLPLKVDNIACSLIGHCDNTAYKHLLQHLYFS